MSVSETVRGRLNAAFAWLLTNRDELPQTVKPLVKAARRHMPRGLVESEGFEELEEVFEGILQTLEDEDGPVSPAPFIEALDEWLEDYDLEWEPEDVRISSPNPAWVAACDAALSELHEGNPSPHGPEVDEESLAAVARDIEAVVGFDARTRRRVIRLLRMMVDESSGWDPWPEELDGQFLATIIS